MSPNPLKSFLAGLKHADFEVAYWDGETCRYGEGEPQVKVTFKKTLPLSFNLYDPILALGEAYMDDIFDFEGSLEYIFQVFEANKDYIDSNTNGAVLAVKALSSAAAKLKQKNDIQHHYDLGNDFFALWLDESLSYSCAYFKTPGDSLHQAQLQKWEHIIKKLHLHQGERLLNIGSGWGQLI